MAEQMVELMCTLLLKLYCVQTAFLNSMKGG
uniref:Uncharacterized protein n=1 Tax=Arundo donax TaxID=35708 RepID=A0A0A8YQ38_ARUDO